MTTKDAVICNKDGTEKSIQNGNMGTNSFLTVNSNVHPSRRLVTNTFVYTGEPSNRAEIARLDGLDPCRSQLRKANSRAE